MHFVTPKTHIEVGCSQSAATHRDARVAFRWTDSNFYHRRRRLCGIFGPVLAVQVVDDFDEAVAATIIAVASYCKTKSVTIRI